MDSTFYRSSMGLLPTSICRRNRKKVVKNFVFDDSNYRTEDKAHTDSEGYNDAMILNHHRNNYSLSQKCLSSLTSKPSINPPGNRSMSERPLSSILCGQQKKHSKQGRRQCKFIDEALHLPIVTKKWTRPRTELQELGRLYYTEQEMDQFRREAEIEEAVTAAIAVASSASGKIW